jgi:LuxR family quorum sensing-dependent transcriptional regulator
MNWSRRFQDPITMPDGSTIRTIGEAADDTFARGLAQRYQPAPVNLTPREMDILRWMAEGKSNWEIGVILRVSEHFVDKVARQLRVKLNATSRAQTVAIALRHNLIR